MADRTAIPPTPPSIMPSIQRTGPGPIRPTTTTSSDPAPTPTIGPALPPSTPTASLLARLQTELMNAETLHSKTRATVLALQMALREAQEAEDMAGKAVQAAKDRIERSQVAVERIKREFEEGIERRGERIVGGSTTRSMGRSMSGSSAGPTVKRSVFGSGVKKEVTEVVGGLSTPGEKKEESVEVEPFASVNGQLDTPDASQATDTPNSAAGSNKSPDAVKRSTEQPPRQLDTPDASQVSTSANRQAPSTNTPSIKPTERLPRRSFGEERPELPEVDFDMAENEPEPSVTEQERSLLAKALFGNDSDDEDVEIPDAPMDFQIPDAPSRDTTVTVRGDSEDGEPEVETQKPVKPIAPPAAVEKSLKVAAPSQSSNETASQPKRKKQTAICSGRGRGRGRGRGGRGSGPVGRSRDLPAQPETPSSIQATPAQTQLDENTPQAKRGRKRRVVEEDEDDDEAPSSDVGENDWDFEHTVSGRKIARAVSTLTSTSARSLRRRSGQPDYRIPQEEDVMVISDDDEEEEQEQADGQADSDEEDEVAVRPTRTTPRRGQGRPRYAEEDEDDDYEPEKEFANGLAGIYDGDEEEEEEEEEEQEGEANQGRGRQKDSVIGPRSKAADRREQMISGNGYRTREEYEALLTGYPRIPTPELETVYPDGLTCKDYVATLPKPVLPEIGQNIIGLKLQYISNVIGGCMQGTFCRVSQKKQRGQIYPCTQYISYKRDWNPDSPHLPGRHGIALAGLRTEEDDGEWWTGSWPTFTCRGTNDWVYCGTYELIPRPMQLEEYRALPPETKRVWAEGFHEKQWGKNAMMKAGVLKHKDEMVPVDIILELLDRNILKSEAFIMKCVGYDEEFYKTLLTHNAAAATDHQGLKVPKDYIIRNLKAVYTKEADIINLEDDDGAEQQNTAVKTEEELENQWGFKKGKLERQIDRRIKKEEKEEKLGLTPFPEDQSCFTPPPARGRKSRSKTVKRQPTEDMSGFTPPPPPRRKASKVPEKGVGSTPVVPPRAAKRARVESVDEVEEEEQPFVQRTITHMVAPVAPMRNDGAHYGEYWQFTFG
ncbi:hypothetical protein BJ508DRAFT_417056 [Ascobolus immersus RN42]|uniref:DUF6697 domain-containing protein n=1 Tax=Ascobolus immersus RN42 TaxID=1160509 RepID=A0A3N4HY67_ASCIM|nr:hypothetical protein BJ508DRAFT_417056 [Ascobolus immersus RN42]